MLFIANTGIVFAQEELSKLQDLGQEVSGATKDVVDAIPEEVKVKAEKAGLFLETFRVQRALAIEVRRNQAEQDFNNAQGEEKITLIWSQAKNIFWNIAYAIFSIKALFYIIGSILVLSVLHRIIDRFRRPSWDA